MNREPDGKIVEAGAAPDGPALSRRTVLAGLGAATLAAAPASAAAAPEPVAEAVQADLPLAAPARPAIPEAALADLHAGMMSMVLRARSRLIDMIRDEFQRSGRRVDPCMALLLFQLSRLPEEERTMMALRQHAAAVDRRLLARLGGGRYLQPATGRGGERFTLTPRALAIAETVAQLQTRQIGHLRFGFGGVDAARLADLNEALRLVDRFWLDTILYRL